MHDAPRVAELQTANHLEQIGLEIPCGRGERNAGGVHRDTNKERWGGGGASSSQKADGAKATKVSRKKGEEAKKHRRFT